MGWGIGWVGIWGIGGWDTEGIGGNTSYTPHPCVFFCPIFPLTLIPLRGAYFPPHQCEGIAIQYAHASRIEDRGENVKKCRKKEFSEWVAEVSRITPTSNTINSELSRASHLPYRQFFFLLFPNISPISWCGIAPPGPLTQVGV